MQPDLSAQSCIEMARNVQLSWAWTVTKDQVDECCAGDMWHVCLEGLKDVGSLCYGWRAEADVAWEGRSRFHPGMALPPTVNSLPNQLPQLPDCCIWHVKQSTLGTSILPVSTEQQTALPRHGTSKLSCLVLMFVAAWPFQQSESDHRLSV